LEDLVQIDQRFAPFRETLFSRAAKQTERKMLTPEKLQHLDDSISKLMRLISPYFLKRAAHKVCEYLIRQFQYEPTTKKKREKQEEKKK
jgi:U3 small nucleolar RNA-associated protein 10